MNYQDYKHLLFEHRSNGVLLVTLNRPDVLNATNARMHYELTQVWATIDADPQTNIVVVTGAGDRAFSAGGDLEWISGMVGNPDVIKGVQREAGDIVFNLLSLEKPVISAINGVAVGAGLAVALMSDISIMSETARITDGHVKLGVGAGDHAAIIWPILCGMANFQRQQHNQHTGDPHPHSGGDWYYRSPGHGGALYIDARRIERGQSDPEHGAKHIEASDQVDAPGQCQCPKD